MYLVYVDESGTPDINDSENFVLGATIINEDKWFEIDKKVKELKEKHFGPGSLDTEIHMCDIAHRKTKFSKLNVSERIVIIQDIMELIKNTEMRTVYIVIKKQRLLKSIDLRHWAYKFLFERICYQLKDLNEYNQKTEYGLLLFDSISKKRNREIWELVSKLLRDGSEYETNEHLIDGPIFSESNIRSPLQLADCIAYVVNHEHKNNQNKDESMRAKFKEFLTIIEGKMPCDLMYSKKIFPEN